MTALKRKATATPAAVAVKVSTQPTRRRAPAKPAAQAAAVPDVAPAVASATTPSPAPAAKKEKRVRSSFTLPESQLALLGELKKRCAAFGANAKKGELLAAGLRLLHELPETALEAAVLPSMRIRRKPDAAKKSRK